MMPWKACHRVGIFSCCILLSTCTPLGLTGSGSQGQCRQSDGTTVNTYRIPGQWKKLSPYTPSRSDTVLETNYDILVIEDGVIAGTVVTPMCLGSVVNNGFSETLYRAQYEHDVANKTLGIKYLAGTGAGTSVTATYSFTGNCNGTRLLLNYGSGTQETYALVSQTVNPGDCNPESQE